MTVIARKRSVRIHTEGVNATVLLNTDGSVELTETDDERLPLGPIGQLKEYGEEWAPASTSGVMGSPQKTQGAALEIVLARHIRAAKDAPADPTAALRAKINATVDAHQEDPFAQYAEEGPAELESEPVDDGWTHEDALAAEAEGLDQLAAEGEAPAEEYESMPEISVEEANEEIAAVVADRADREAEEDAYGYPAGTLPEDRDPEDRVLAEADYEREQEERIAEHERQIDAEDEAAALPQTMEEAVADMAIEDNRRRAQANLPEGVDVTLDHEFIGDHLAYAVSVYGEHVGTVLRFVGGPRESWGAVSGQRYGNAENAETATVAAIQFHYKLPLNEAMDKARLAHEKREEQKAARRGKRNAARAEETPEQKEARLAARRARREKRKAAAQAASA